MAFAFSRLTGMRVYAVQPNPVVNSSLFEVRADEVDIVHCAGWRSLWLKLRWTLKAFEVFAVSLSTELAYEAHWYAQRKYFPALLIRWCKASTRWFDARGKGSFEDVYRGRRLNKYKATKGTSHNPYENTAKLLDDLGSPVDIDGLIGQAMDEFHQAKNAKLYLFRRNIEQPLNTYLPADMCADLRERLSQLGIQPATKMVTVHARESGFHQGEEIQDASVILLEGRKFGRRKFDNRTDIVRNARIDSYSQAIDYLVKEGYAVVRLGDPLMEPYHRAGLFDLATSPIRTPALELYCLLQSEFVLCGESGPYSVSYLTNTPSVLVNATDPISGYPVRKDRLYILKRVHDRSTGQPLRLNDMLTHRYLSKMRQMILFQYVDNTSDEILEVVREMVSGLRDGWVATSKQRAYREQATAAAIEFNKRERDGGIAYVRKWGEDRGFLGSGYIGANWAERHFQTHDS